MVAVSAPTSAVDQFTAATRELQSRVADLERAANRASAWTAVTFQNAWVNYGTYATAAYRKVGDVVQIRGLVKDGTMAAAIFTLPAGYRPPLGLHFATASNGAYGQIFLTDAGVVNASVGSNVWFSITCQFSVTT